jgi:serine O-acetyltransferase
MLLDDLGRYNEYGCRPKSFSFWKHMARQAYTHPGLLAVVVYRYGGWVRRCRIPVVKQICEAYYQILYGWVRFHLQIEVPRDTVIGPGFRIDHYGGILINSQSVIGRNFTATQGLLVGQTETGAPHIGDDVHCGVGCKIIGGIVLGDGIKIGAGAVVTRSFEGNMVIAGVPARMLRKLDGPPRPGGWIPPTERSLTPTEEAVS